MALYQKGNDIDDEESDKISRNYSTGFMTAEFSFGVRQTSCPIIDYDNGGQLVMEKDRIQKKPAGSLKRKKDPTSSTTTPGGLTSSPAALAYSRAYHVKRREIMKRPSSIGQMHTKKFKNDMSSLRKAAGMHASSML